MTTENFLRSIKDLSKFMGCSEPVAQRFKNQNPQIFYQFGRKFMVKEEDVLAAMKGKPDGQN